MSKLTQSPQWLALQNHYQEIANVHLQTLFDNDPQRFEQFSIEFDGLFLDFSKNRIDSKTLTLLFDLAESINLKQKIAHLFNGEHINFTEQRAALHTALRSPRSENLLIDNVDIIAQIHAVLDKMETFVDKISNGDLKGYSGKPITDIVNIGIGGSHLGPLMVSEALKPFTQNKLRLHFLSNIHSGNIKAILKDIKPEQTLFIVSTKSFSTIEVKVNTHTILQWFEKHTGNRQNFFQQAVTVTSNKKRALEFGFAQETIFDMWDWVGGRYSLWSAIGLPIALTIGMENFKALLSGAHAMDQHFLTAPFHQNMPIILAMLGIWYNNFFKTKSHAILPYNYHLRYLPAYLQQLDMESNGKQVNSANAPIEYDTGPIIWGEMGTNGQHAFHQLLHQGTQFVPADFIIDMAIAEEQQGHDVTLFASCLGQTAALMKGINYEEAYSELLARGYTAERAKELAVHKVHPGNRPSNMILINGLTPYHLGMLIALYEHKVFVQGAIWGINSFDQWGVELGKEITQQLQMTLQDKNIPEQYDASTKGLIAYFFSKTK